MIARGRALVGAALLASALAGCALGWRGRSAVAPDGRRDAQGSVAAQFLYTGRVLAGATYSEHHWSVPVGYRVLDTRAEFDDLAGVRLWPYVALSRDITGDAYGGEAGAHVRAIRYAYAEAGVQQTFGDRGATMPFFGLGVDIGLALVEGCGCF